MFLSPFQQKCTLINIYFSSFPFHPPFLIFFSPPHSLSFHQESHISADIWNVWIGQSSLRGLVSVRMPLCVCVCVLSRACTAYSLTSTHSKSFLSSLLLKQRVKFLDLCINRNSFPAGEPCYGERGTACDIYGVSFCPALRPHPVCALTTHLRRSPLTVHVRCVCWEERFCILFSLNREDHQ